MMALLAATAGLSLVGCGKHPAQDAAPNSGGEQQAATPAAPTLPRNVPLVDTEILDKLRTKLDPSLLEDEGYATELFYMREPSDYEQFHGNEFDWPKKLAASRAHAKSWCRSAPGKLRVVRRAKLGTYDPQKHAFPLLNWLSGKPLVAMGDLDVSTDAHRRWPNGNYTAKDRLPGNTKFHLLDAFVVVFPEPFLMTDLPLDEDKARTTVEQLKSLGKDRIIELAFDVEPVGVDFQAKRSQVISPNFEGLNQQGTVARTDCLIVNAKLSAVTAYYKTSQEGKFFDNYEEIVLGTLPLTPPAPKP